MKLSRGLALMLVLFGGLYAGLGPWLSASRGPATSSFEALRRYDAAASRGQAALAGALGGQALALAHKDSRWSPAQLADLARRVATTERSGGHDEAALAYARMATADVARANDASVSLVVRIAELHGDLALESGDRLEAICTYGGALERLGPDRITHPEGRLRPSPVLVALTAHLDSIGDRFAEDAAPASLAAERAEPLTTCNLVADFYADRHDYAAAAGISRIVLDRVFADPSIGSEIKAGLLQDGAHIAELNNDVPTAEARLNMAIAVLQGKQQKPALAVALEALAALHSNWSDSKGAQAILKKALALKQQLYGVRSPSLIAPLVALGYTQIDTNDPSGAEATLKHALDIAQTPPRPDPSATLEVMLALNELYEEQGLSQEADTLSTKIAALQKAGASLKPSDVEDVPIAVAPADGRLAVFDIAFGSPHARGHIEVALNAPKAAPWTRSWASGTFVSASDPPNHPLVYAPRLAKLGDADPTIGATLVFIPGQGTSLASGAARLARLQALIGPGQSPVLIDWAADERLGDGVRDAGEERVGRLALESVIDGIPASRQSLTFVAEGRGANVLATALKEMNAEQRRTIADRLKTLILVAPDLPDATLQAWLAGLEKGRVRTVIYAAPTARPLLIAKALYGDTPIGLDPARVARLGVETIEIGEGKPWADFDTLSSDALIADIGSVIKGEPAGKRCGIVAANQTGGIAKLSDDAAGCELAKLN
jgi:tetratricopeptide (TPR) repeat protein